MNLPEFTSDERRRIDNMYANNLENLTSEDVQLLVKWENAQALAQSEYQAKIDAITKEADEKLAMARNLNEIAANNLAELHAAALARLEALDNVETQ